MSRTISDYPPSSPDLLHMYGIVHPIAAGPQSWNTKLNRDTYTRTCLLIDCVFSATAVLKKIFPYATEEDLFSQGIMALSRSLTSTEKRSGAHLKQRIVKTLRASGQTLPNSDILSLEETIDQGFDSPASSSTYTYAPPASEQIDIRNQIQKVLMDTVTFREREIISLQYGLYGEQYTLTETARIFKVTPERVRQIRTKTLKKLQHPSRKYLLVQLLKEHTSLKAPQSTIENRDPL